jgi:predicted RND superfamily exporter protein
MANYDMFEGWMTKINSESPGATSDNAFQTSEGDFNGPNWVWAHTQGIFISTAVSGATIGCIIAFVVILIATKQIIIAISAFVTIVCILLSVIAMMKIAGYELGTITSICITILAGFAVDYVVHLAHAYEASTAPTRKEKTQEAMDVIGVSVFSGMITSVLAAFALLLCSLQFFAKFGFFLIFTVIWAWIWGCSFFMSLMYTIGPDDNTPAWLQFPKSICKMPKKEQPA